MDQIIILEAIAKQFRTALLEKADAKEMGNHHLESEAVSVKLALHQILSECGFDIDYDDNFNVSITKKIEVVALDRGVLHHG